MFFLAVLAYTFAFLAECGPSVRPDTTQAIIQVESGGDPLAINDNTLRKSLHPKSEKEAIELASRLIEQGHSVDIGLMQVNSCHIRPMKLTLPELFSPCQNIRIGTSILHSFYQQNRIPGDPVQSLFRALSAYNTGRSWKGTAYINRILRTIGASYHVTPPTGTLEPRPSARKSAASSPLFFDNLSSSMTANEL